MAMSEVILFNALSLSQFTDREQGSEARATLADFIHARFRPAGRLIMIGGLLVLTADGAMNRKSPTPWWATRLLGTS